MTNQKSELVARGWSANWLVGWLAAIGAASRTGATLRFTRSALPVALLDFGDVDDPIAQLSESLVTSTELEDSVIARIVKDGLGEFPRKPTLSQYAERSRLARSSGDRMLGATVTDLTSEVVELAHSPLDAAMPKGITLWERAVSCRALVPTDVRAAVTASLDGRPTRVSTNGLGFDPRRITVATAPNANKLVDPIAELFAFEALTLFSARGSGGKAAVVRGWRGGQTRRHALTWPIWQESMPMRTIDALLDQFWNRRPSSLAAGQVSRSVTPTSPRNPLIDTWAREVEPYGIFGAFGSIPYQATGSADTTRGFSSEELWNRP